MPLPKISSPVDYIPLKLIPAPAVQVVRKVEIIHSPIKDILLENNAVRANAMLSALLSTLAAREAIVDIHKSEKI